MLARSEARTPAQIAASVKRTTEHERAEERYEQARSRRNDVRKKMHATIAINRNGQHDRTVIALSSEVSELDAEVSRVRAEVLPFRQAHGAAVANALADVRRQAALQIVEAINDMSAALATIEETTVAIESAGGECIRLPAPTLQYALATAKRIAGR